MNLPDVRSTRSAIAAMTYDGTDSIRSAAELRQRMAATVDLARRARVDAREHLWNAREAERALGRMILAAREAGDLYDQDSRVSSNTTLADLEISRDLAAHAVALARVPDEVWIAWHDWDADPTQTAVGRSARTYQTQLDAVRAEAEQARQEARRLAERKAEIERELAAVAETPLKFFIAVAYRAAVPGTRSYLRRQGRKAIPNGKGKGRQQYLDAKEAKLPDILSFLIANHDRRLADAHSEREFVARWCEAHADYDYTPQRVYKLAGVPMPKVAA